MELHVGDVDVGGVVVLGVVVVGASDVNVLAHAMIHVEEAQGDAVDAVGTARGVAGHTHALHRAGIHHADGSGARDLEVVDVGGLDQGKVGDVEVMRPVDAGDHAVVPVSHLVVVVVPQLGLPQDGPLLKMQIHEGAHEQAGDHVAAAIEILATGQDHPTAACLGHGVDGGLNGHGVVGEAVALSAEIRDGQGVIGEVEGVGVLVEVLVVLNVEAVAEPQGGHTVLFREDGELVGQTGGVLVAQGDAVDDDLTLATLGDHTLTQIPLACGEILLVGHGGGVELHLAAGVGRQGLGTRQRALEGDGLGHGIGGEGQHLTPHLADGLLLLEGVAMDDQLTHTVGLQGEGLQPSAAVLAADRQIEVVGMGLSVLIQRQRHRARATVVGNVRQLRFGGGGLVLDDYEHGVAERHNHVVDAVRVIREGGRGQKGFPVQRQHHGTASVGNTALLAVADTVHASAVRRVEVGLTAHLAQSVQHVAVGHGDIHLGDVPAVGVGPHLQRHADGGKVHLQSGDETRFLGHVDYGAEGLSLCAPQGHAAEHTLALALGEHEARHLGESLPLLGSQGNLHGGNTVLQSQGADGLGGLEDEAACLVVLRNHPLVGGVGVVGLAHLFVGVLILDKVTGHGHESVLLS